MAKKESAVYLFCFARSDLLGELRGNGVDGPQGLFVFRRFPDLCAVVSEVALEDFCGPAAEVHMQRLTWVGPRALRHEEVIEEVMRQSPVLPARFGTLFSSPESLGAFLDKHREAIREFLAQVAEREEWSVKGLLDRRVAGKTRASASLASQQAQLAALPPGTRYFHEQRIRAGAEKELSLWVKGICRQAASELGSQAAGFCECPVAPQEHAESGVEVVLNWAFLLPRSGAAIFRARVNRLNAHHARQGLAFELSGPWPPYRFVPPLSREGAS